MRKWVVLLALLRLGGVEAQIDHAREWVKTLCSPNFHGRGYVQHGDSLAANYLKMEFEKLGVRPLNQSYLQPFQHSVNTFPAKMEMKLGSVSLTPGIHFMVDPSSGGGSGVYDFEYMDPETALSEADLTNSIKDVIAVNENLGILLNAATVKGDSLQKLKAVADELANYLPIVVVVNEKFTWSVANEMKPFPFVYVQDSVFHYEDGIYLNIESELIQKYTSYNVIAKIPAKKKSKGTMVFTAHYDHLGRMGSETYYPGANDNATGTSMLLSLAEYYREKPGKLDVVFIAFAGEEAGLVGSRYYTQYPLFPLKQIRFLVNLDIMGSGEDGVTAVNSTEFPKEFKVLEKVNKKGNYLVQIKERGPAANSDHYFFTQKGVPSFFIYTMGPNKHYHDVFDNYEELSFGEYEDIYHLLIDFTKKLR